MSEIIKGRETSSIGPREDRIESTVRTKISGILQALFAWLSRTFTPRRHATAKAIEASIRSAKKVYDVRGGSGARAKIRTIEKELNGYKGSKFIKQKKIS